MGRRATRELLSRLLAVRVGKCLSLFCAALTQYLRLGIYREQRLFHNLKTGNSSED
jgi:hypothetical protein